MGGGTGYWTQGLAHAKHMSLPLNYTPSLWYMKYFRHSLDMPHIKFCSFFFWLRFLDYLWLISEAVCKEGGSATPLTPGSCAHEQQRARDGNRVPRRARGNGGDRVTEVTGNSSFPRTDTNRQVALTLYLERLPSAARPWESSRTLGSLQEG